MYPISEVRDIDIAFPATVKHLMPDYKDIPEEFKRGRTKWNRIFAQWFFSGFNNANFIAKDGVDQSKALRHIKTVMGSYEPKHKHKEAAVAFLLSEWFDDVTYNEVRE